ncbi:MAG: hypothetical protein K6F73_03855 [Lachnospiraceae bacterium]|nr:hypothetical protein [Lachnospiraceae bacterium]
MDFYETIEKRRTIRDFEPEDIPDEVASAVLRVYNNQETVNRFLVRRK